MGIKPHSATLVSSADDRDLADRLSCALGYAPYDSEQGQPAAQTMVVALSPSGRPPATLWAAHSRADDAFVALFSAAGSGSVPERPQPDKSWEYFGLSQQLVVDLASRITVRITQDQSGAPSWQPTLDELGVTRVQSDEAVE